MAGRCTGLRRDARAGAGAQGGSAAGGPAGAGLGLSRLRLPVFVPGKTKASLARVARAIPFRRPQHAALRLPFILFLKVSWTEFILGEGMRVAGEVSDLRLSRRRRRKWSPRDTVFPHPHPLLYRFQSQVTSTVDSDFSRLASCASPNPEDVACVRRPDGAILGIAASRSGSRTKICVLHRVAVEIWEAGCDLSSASG